VSLEEAVFAASCAFIVLFIRSIEELEEVKKKYIVLFVSLGTLLLLISACSQPITGPASGTGSSLTPLQVLQKSANAMQQLKSAHVEMQSADSLQAANATTTTETPTTTGTPATSTSTPTTFSLTVKGSGDEALPDQEQLSLTVNQNTHLSEIVQGNKVYVQNAQGQWYVLDKSAFQGIIGNPFSGINVDQNSLLALIQNSQITDHGTQALNGQNLRHITAILNKEGLRQLLNDNPQLAGNLGQQNIDAILNNTRLFVSSVDVWIDETQFYVHRTELKLNLTADTSGLNGTPSTSSSLPSSITANIDTTIDLSKFNVPVTITPPTNAISTDNPAAIFGLGT
jgi:hypothetical protein